MKKNIGSIISIFFILLIIAVPVFYFLSKNHSDTRIITLEVGEQYIFNQESVIKSEDSINIEDNKVIFNEQGRYTIIETEKNGRLTTYIFDIKDSSNNNQNNENNEQENNSNNNSNNNNNNKTNSNSNDNKTTNNSNNNNNNKTNSNSNDNKTTNNSNNNQNNAGTIIDVKSISLNYSNLTLKVGEMKTIIAIINPDNATNQTITWTSSNSQVVTVSNGLIICKSVGSATITARSSNNKEASVVVTVISNEIPVKSINLSKTSLNIIIGSTETLLTKISPTNATNQDITWTSSNTKIATVSKGKITPKRTGTVTITASSGNVSESCKVTITGSRIHFIDIDSSADTILLESNGKFAMVDTGVYRARKTIKSYLDSLDIKDIEFLVISHSHSDHLGSAVYLSTKYNIKKLYIKSYLGNDKRTPEELATQTNNYNNVINSFKGKVVYVDKDSNFKETKKSSGYVNLGKMKISFFNTNQRLNQKPSNVSTKYVGYYSPSYYYGGNENSNSIVNFVEVNNHTALLGADMTLFEVMQDIFNDRINGKVSKIDVFKIPHHGIYNCFGAKKANEKLSYTLKASVGYYVVTRAIDGKTEKGNYVITPNKVIPGDSDTEYNSCMYNIAKGNEEKAKDIMCNAYYVSDATKDAIIFNFSNEKVAVSGGGKGKNVSTRCK